MLVRVRSKDGNFRFELNPEDDASVLFNKILETTSSADPDTITVSQRPTGGETQLNTLFGRSLTNLGLKHTDLIFVAYKSAEQPASSNAPVAPVVPVAPAPSDAIVTHRPWELVQEDPVDQYWRQQDGKIPRKRDPNFCRHGDKGMCDYCMPLEPYDATYQASKSIKHLSFHAYLRQIAPQQAAPSATSNTTGGGAILSNTLPPLEPLSYRVKIPCPTGTHPPYPAGICTGCQPSAITLTRQVFRTVDHVEVASPSIIESFLGSWRLTGRQRFGWMLGKYVPYEEVPMGVKAVVEAIHEPPQEGDLDGLSLDLPWDDEARIVELAKEAGLEVVGMIYTDLTPEPEDKTKTICKRHGDSYFLSSLETIFAAQEQLKRPLKTRSSPTGIYSSRLVTAVLSGTPEGGVDLACYMASEQACAMVDADMIEATVEANTVRIKLEEEGEGRYVPDVFFTYKNEYKLEIKQSAKPCFPVEYLLVNVTHGFPTSPSPLFRSSEPFSIENRPLLEPQDISQVLSALHRIGAQKLRSSRSTDSNPEEQSQIRRSLLQFLSDWHLLAFLPNAGVLSEEDVKAIIRVATQGKGDDPTVLDPILKLDGWRTLITIAEQTAAPARPSTSAPSGGNTMDEDFEIPPGVYDDVAGGGSADGGFKACPHCTFENPAGASDCEVCGLPLT